MAQILVNDIDEANIKSLESRAAQNGRSLDAEVKLLLEEAAQVDMSSARAVASRIRAKLKDRPMLEDSTQIVRELRGA